MLGGALAVPPVLLAGPPAGAGAVRLTASAALVDTKALARENVLTYAFTVRAHGATARDVRLRLTASEPMSWGRPPRECAASGTRLRCVLGDVGGSRRLQVDLRIPRWTRLSRMSRVPSLTAVVTAGNVDRPSRLRLVPPAGRVPPSDTAAKSGAGKPLEDTKALKSGTTSKTSETAAQPKEPTIPEAPKAPAPPKAPRALDSSPDPSSPSPEGGKPSEDAPKHQPKATTPRGSSRPEKSSSTPKKSTPKKKTPKKKTPKKKTPKKKATAKETVRPPHQTPRAKADYEKKRPSTGAAPSSKGTPQARPSGGGAVKPRTSTSKKPNHKPSHKPGRKPRDTGGVPSWQSDDSPSPRPRTTGAHVAPVSPSNQQHVPPLPPLPSASTPVVAPSGDRGADTKMTLVSPAGLYGGEGTPWLVVLGMVVVAEVALLWLATCLALLRARLIQSMAARAARRRYDAC
ncbi:MAG: hypothetical protein IRY90_04920 [Actinomadura rubrobrunea]|nr:hypothetical protein [Actinomadura rubrobrunea]